MRFLIVAISTSCAAQVLSACGGSDLRRAGVVVDTLPNGAVVTMSTQPIDSGHWSLSLERTIQPAPGDVGELLAPADIALAEDGSIALVEERPSQVKIFAPNGTFVRSIGRAGDGPGEFRVAFIAIRGDTLVVQDPRSSRISTFNWRTGDFLGARTSVCCYWSPITVDGAGRAVLSSIANHPDSTVGEASAFVRMGLRDEPPDTVFVVEGHPRNLAKYWEIKEGDKVKMIMTPPYQPVPHYAALPSGNFLTGWTAEYVIRETHNGRDTVAIFGRAFRPTAVSEEEKRALVDERVTELRSADDGLSEVLLRTSLDVRLIPSTRPAYEALWIDAAGNRWVLASQPDSTVRLIDLFDRDGRWLDVLRIPASLWGGRVALGKDRVVIAREGPDGRPAILVFKFGRNG